MTGIDPDTFPSAIKAYFSPIFFESCTFRALAVPSRGSPLEAGEFVYGAIHAHGMNASLAFQNCSFADIRSEHLISARGGSAVYSDNPAHTVRLQLASHWRTPSTAVSEEGSRNHLRQAHHEGCRGILEHSYACTSLRW